ncbi:filamentous hemagglutinin N-terminal domain-containing protein [Megasphaera sp.]|uniref:filamentous hemagglutinin N-terminal domain-containing protein n=1 Tax=Megasphaera sp. TaxID=2023260 RepID=UPI0035208315
MKRNTYKKRIKRQVLLTLFAGMTAFSGAITGYGASGVVPNNELPQGGQSRWKNHTGLNQNVGSESKPVMNIHQQGKNGVISWNSFNIGANGTVNFSSDTQGFNTLNYVNSGNASQIYGKLTGLGGNLYIVNPAGVQIGPSAQINVGSLHVAAKNLDLDAVSKNPTDVAGLVKGGTLTSAQLMSLGNISANKVTFEGNGRIVIDTEKLENLNREKNENFEVLTNDANHVVLGYDAYDKEKGYAGEDKTFGQVSVSGAKTNVTGYMWVEDAAQLQAIDTNLSGKYALKNSIDAIGTKDLDGGKGFKPLGSDREDGFTGIFDSLEFHIFDLTINRSDMDNVGLFSKTNGATLNNVTLVGGKITGQNNVGTLVGSATNTTITGAVNSAAVVGSANVGGLVGTGTGVTLKDAVNMGDITGTDHAVGGLAGNFTNGVISGKSYNIGNVGGPDDTNQSYDVGGLVGVATDSALGNKNSKDGIIYNGLTVKGKYNVGGIAGRLKNSTLQHAENRSAIKATGFTTESYVYQGKGYSPNNPKVQVSNVGGLVGISAGNTFTSVTNLGNISSSMGEGKDYYDGGNVGGIVGRAEDTNITMATNQETKVTGAHNVGGIAGYFGGKGTITSAVNDGAEIMATGGRTSSDFATEMVRPKDEERVHFGNMGGIVGYLYGNDAYVTKSTNSGNVHSKLIAANATTVSESSLAANTGGIVGKIDRTTTLTKEDILNGKQAAVSDSYNSGTVQGFIGIGGVVGQMYNGEVVRSYNLGDIRTTKTVASLDSNKLPTANMGGVVGDTTEDTLESVRALIYDVYNKGKIGDETFTYAARHVGGVVGRLKGDLEKAYNSGDVYNGYNVVVGVVGWYHRGSIKDVFNTGNVTVKNQDKLKSGNPSKTSSVGGIIGAAAPKAGLWIENAYNIGTIRSYQVSDGGMSAVGGIAGRGPITMSNVYTLGTVVAYDANGNKTAKGVGRIVGEALEGGIDYNTANITNGYYIETGNSEFTYTDSKLSSYGRKGTVIQWEDRFNPDSYQGFMFSNYEADGKKRDDANKSWRMYDNTLPMLNAFLPDTEAYFSKHGLTDSKGNALSSVQYGTEYDPNLTIIKTKNDLSFDWNTLSLGGDSRIAVYGGGLTLTGVDTVSKPAYFNGNIDSTGNLVLSGKKGADMLFGAGADLHGSSVTISADGLLSLDGNIVATGENGASDISITAGDVKSYGKIESVKEGGETTVPGIAEKRDDDASYGDVSDMKQAVTETGIRYSKTVTSQGTGNVTITAGDEEHDGSVTLGYGIQGKGLVRTGGSLNVEGTGDVYVESDLSVGKDISLKSTGDASEVVLDVTNIGLDAKPQNQAEGLKDFMNHFNKVKREGKITLETASGDAKFAVDLWDDAKGESKGEYTFNKFGSKGEDNEGAIKNAFNSMDATVKIGENSYPIFGSATDKTNGFMYVWVDGADQLQGIQDFVNNDSNAAYYNYALKSDIDASVLKNYKAIGGDTGYQGTFDGRGHAIIGLTAGGSEAANTGVFSAVGEQGAVKNLSVLAGNFTGKDNVGAVAGVNKGTISDITTYGNTVTSDGHAGGLVGTNEKIIKDSTSVSNVIANSQEAMAGGIAGLNDEGAVIDNSESNSAVAGSVATSSGLGGVAGVNKGTISKVDNLGVTNGGDSGSSAVGGIAGINTGSIENAYNESFVTGGEKTGGLVGINEKSGSLVNAANAGRVEGKGKAQEIGGLVGDNDGSILNGRNGGNVTGTTYVGGIVGTNREDSTLTDIINDTSILIKGSTYVGGIAGQNAGRIVDTEASRTLSDGVVEGVEYVGGIAGKNKGYIENPHNNISLRINKDALKDGKTAQYFGGVAGINEQEGTIGNATNLADVTAEGANYVGGIVGYNKGTLLDLSGNRGNVVGANYVGGVAGINEHSLSDVDASNTGSVQALQGGAGGIFAVNHGDVTNSRLVNDAVVAGGAHAGATGGIFAENTVNIGKTTLVNGMNAEVIGLKNVGGLVGENSGTISGGRDASDGYYKDKVYNNGVIEAGTWHDENGNHQIDAGEVTEGAGENIGGLVGKNTGSVTAAYNTGAIKAKDSTYVGGIAGTNAGKIDQVFSSIFTQDGNEGQVEGKTAVGGLIGLNTEKGIVTDAYTTGKAPNGGSIAGENQGLLKNVYSVTGKDESIAATNTGRIENGYALDRENDASLAEDTYGGFTFGSKWKIYEGYSSPLLKVFLTKATYDAMTGELIWAADGFAANHGSGQGLIHQGLGTGSNYFWSQQLAFAGGHPNWLGYDLDPQYEKPSGNYDHLFDDAPFGKREPNRERKAEISFERGGMEV